MQDANATVETKGKSSSAPRKQEKRDELPPYHVILLDDNEHSYDYVIDMLILLFSHSSEQAFRLAEVVDRTGRAIVCTTHKERAELKCDQIMGFGGDQRVASSKSSMRATVEPAEG